MSSLQERAPNVPTTQSRTLHDLLRDDIIFGRLEPGQKLKIEVLQVRYSSGATPLREALSLLVATGLVERIDNRGFRTAYVGLKEFEENLWTRCILEERALRDAIENGGPEWEGRIVISLHHLRRFPPGHVFEDDVEEGRWEVLHAEFHTAVLAACRSRPLLRFCGQLYDASRRYRHIARQKRGSRANALAEHEAIGKAVLARDADAAVALLTAHYERTGDLLRGAFERLKTED